MSINVFAAKHKDNDIRLKSSSGAVFFELARQTISQNGVVFGAAFDSEWNVYTSYSEDINACIKFLGSKYVQSNIGTAYEAAKEFLMDGKQVLFSGTPCQISGLKSYLGKLYDNLLTVDFICHGVPSPGVWREYLKNISQNRLIEKINFRDKTEGWLNYYFTIDFLDGTVYRIAHEQDLYMNGFLHNIILRPSCYECKFKGVERESDITLADYWGVNNFTPELHDNKGTSLLIIHTKKGNKIWSNVSSQFDHREVQFNLAFQSNSSFFTSATKTLKRNIYFRNGIGEIEFLKRLTGNLSLSQKICFMGKYVFGKLLISKKSHIRKYENTNDEYVTIPTLYGRKELCCGCTACSEICSQRAISMIEDKDGFDYPQIDKEKCVHCLRCVNVCPLKSSRKSKILP